ncbi:MAG TPA: DUF5681 domain-containing protein [Stellaceae bacterium]|nr:DUF5681 domain-containing protein [Stellaceae bacterium]
MAIPTSPDFPVEQQTPADPVEPAAAPEPSRPRGRPWAKGQSGNPRGRPSRARQAAYVAEGLIQRKTVPLTNKLIELALTGDRAALRACLDRIVPTRREPPIDLDLPETLESRADFVATVKALTDAAASGALTTSQSIALSQTLIALWRATW